MKKLGCNFVGLQERQGEAGGRSFVYKNSARSWTFSKDLAEVKRAVSGMVYANTLFREHREDSRENDITNHCSGTNTQRFRSHSI